LNGEASAIVLVKDESQQAAELRQAFLKHFPRRMDMLQRKGLRLVRGPWDVNSATLVLQEVQRLAGAAGRHGLVDASERLYQLELRLTTFLQNLSVPDDDQRQLLETLLEQLPVGGSLPAEPGLLSAISLRVDAPVTARALFLQPPDDYWRRFSGRDVVPMDSHNSPTAAAVRLRSSDEPPPTEVLQSEDGSAILLMGDFQPPELDAASSTTDSAESAQSAESGAPADVAESASDLAVDPGQPEPLAPKRVFYLADIAPFARELCAELTRSGYLVERQESAEELKEVLGSLAPDVVLIDAAFFDEIEHLGEFIRRVRARVQTSIPLLLFAPSEDLESRLKALRAGAASVLSADLKAGEAADRVRELVAPQSEQPFRVLIVEDDRSQALFAESVLKKAGMETCAVTDALQTLDQLERFRPDLILMDLYMPDISGMELTAIIRERPDFISTPIVFLSGEQDSEKQFEALDAGGDDFLSKPIRPKHLMAAVNNRARRARAQDRRRSQHSREEDTGLFERALLLDKLSECMLYEAGEHGGGLLFIQIADGALLRERIGLLGYERALGQVGALIVSFLGHGEMATRFGNESFLLLAPTRNGEQLESLAEQILDAVVRERLDARANAAGLTLNIGGALLGEGFVDPGALLAAAERSCARAGDEGSGFALHRSESPTSEEGALDLIRQALEDDRFELLFQPIVSLQGGHGAQYEALLRLRSEDGQLLHSEALQEAAGKLGLLGELDRWVLRRALMTIDERSRRGEKLRLYLNQSVSALSDRELPGWLSQMLATRRIEASSLLLEFRLGEVLANLQEAMNGLQTFKQIGVGLVLDEFEPDMTALQMLSYLPVDFLKLHQRFSAPQLDQASSLELRQLIQAAHDANKKVMASRVENAPTAASLWTLGVDFIQGNFVQQPGAELGFDFSASAL
jgi:PleD family two-component response regulator/EAL domain-containing protein (putative c-di-GMP-specific phosphodiesterase class I)